MNTYLRAVGFSGIKTQMDYDQLIMDCVRRVKKKKEIIIDDTRNLVEVICMSTSVSGIRVYGERDEKGMFHFSYLYPFVKGYERNHMKEVFVNKRVDTNGLSGMCEDDRFGMSLIFFIKDPMEINEKYGDVSSITDCTVVFSALSVKGTIILPSYIPENVKQKLLREKKQNVKLINDAKNGVEGAIESLTLWDYSKVAEISERIKKEDVLTIVESSCYPNGSESDNYNVIGTIRTAKKLKNMLSKEDVWELTIVVNGMMINVMINDNDLVGEPATGRRFKGEIWLQGSIVDEEH